jgi:hypothetical protein
MKASLSLFVLALAGTGCGSIRGSIDSVSDSSAGVIESLKSPFVASSKSSGIGGTTEGSANYQRDVHSYALARLVRDDEPGEFLRGMSASRNCTASPIERTRPTPMPRCRAGGRGRTRRGGPRPAAQARAARSRQVARAFGEASPRR